MAKKPKDKEMYHIAEWYGEPYYDLSDARRQQLAGFKASGKMLQKDEMKRILKYRDKAANGTITAKETTSLQKLEAQLTGLQATRKPCPFRTDMPFPFCTKPGGVCSMRLYEEKPPSIAPVTGERAYIRAMCPYRFQEKDRVFQHIGNALLGDPTPFQAGEVGFLKSTGNLDSPAGRSVGNIDMVLVALNTPAGHPKEWCAVEVQAVYFSGKNMPDEIREIYKQQGKLTMPKEGRRPDYRSSGPKRLMPQLQIKVPTLRRWGKKMVVVVDVAFFKSMGKMRPVKDVSNCDIVWCLVDFEQPAPGQPYELKVIDPPTYTTLEAAIEGLTGGDAVPLGEFESGIQEKIDAAP
ncbi:hypothetical protein K7H20_23035 [Salipiger manganoxidans]|uniref:NotI family restriction endonuclease n=1 Tax=Salipiger marinus TaxID=555512 RepID=UPI001E6474DA|nr:NotI family restriction endonuclease [Salipiger manganoxidans]MCD1620933.1 hypothetical protein [Salipiger manganoxidans]